MSFAPFFGRYASLPLFVVYALIPRDDGRTDKVPVDPLTLARVDAQLSVNRMPLADAEVWVGSGIGHGVGFVITDDVPVVFLDIDHCRDANGWHPHAASFLSRFPGAYNECSSGGDGLHMLASYTGPKPEHRTRNKDYRLELYSQLRFCALTGTYAHGSVETDVTAAFHELARDYFAPREDDERSGEWTDGPVAAWSGPTDDAELIRRALRSHSAASVFGGRAAFADLWAANADVLAHAFPSQGAGAYDASSADLALANHLAFWTGNDCDRMARLMFNSALVREKWQRPDYFNGTILRACGSQREWYNDGGPRPPQTPPTPTATVVLHTGEGAPVVVPVAPPAPSVPSVPLPVTLAENELPPNGSYVTLPMQQQLFAGMTYIRDIHNIQLRTGDTLSKDRFDASYGGRQYAMTADGQRPSKSAWDAFILSELADFPKVHGQFFEPRLAPATIIEREGRAFVNSWWPIHIAKLHGDASPFVNHIKRILPLGMDAELLIYYLAACVQYPGVKFQYCPLIQGVEGNGKTLISVIMEKCIGERYTHWPKAAELGSKFNAPFYGKILVCVNDVFTVESKGVMWETLKPMITETKLEIEPKGVDKVMREVCFNFILNTNHKDGLRKTKNDRRIMPLFCAQQHVEDLARDGLTQNYFNHFRAWVHGEGGAIVADYLTHLVIPDEYNPATSCIVAPHTSATIEAIEAGHGAAEQEILEAVGQGAEGFRNGWLSSTALDHLLSRIGKERAVPRRARRAMLAGLGYIPHPALAASDGRLTTRLPDGTQPVMYIQKGHTWSVAHLTNAQLVAAYLEQQKL